MQETDEAEGEAPEGAGRQIDRVVGAITRSGEVPQREARSNRRAAFDYLLDKLGPTDLGRRLGLRRFASFVDMCTTVPVHAPEEHLTKIEAALGFGPALANRKDIKDPGAAEREEVVHRWAMSLAQHRCRIPRRCYRLGVEADPALARWEGDDFAALMGPEGVLERDRAQDPQTCLDALNDFEADALIVPSLASVSWLESHGRARIERLVPTLRVLFAQHDLDEPLRSRLPVIPQGLLHPGGRLSLPPRVGDHPRAGRLAWSSCLLELLREDESTRPLPRREALSPVLPEHAVLGERYEIVLSSGTGFLRMRTGVFVRVVAFDRLRDGPRLVPVPVFVPLPAPPGEFALEGVRVPGAILTAALRQAFEREDPALVAAEIGGAPRRDPELPTPPPSPMDSGFFDGTELGTIAQGRTQLRPVGLELRVEVQGRTRPDFPTRLAARFDAIVRERSPAYDYLRQREELQAPLAVIVAGGSEQRARKLRASRFRGTVGRPQIRIAG